jgi:hypothetical protein
MMMNKHKEKPEKKWEYAGLKCFVMKVVFESGTFHRCGYVTIPKNHVCHGLSYDDIPVDVHGGLTYGIDNTFGFDTTHCGDKSSNEIDSKGHFWTLDDVVKETNSMAEQFSKITLLEIINYKLRYMPDWFKDNIEIKEGSHFTADGRMK